MNRFVSLGLVVLISGCAVGPDYVPPEPQVAEAWLSGPEGTAPGEAFSGPAWWNALQDPTLSGLIEGAVASNKDLAVAAARVREARALRGAAAASLFPQVEASAGGTRYRLSEE